MLNCQLCLKYSRSKRKQDTNLSLGQEIPLFPWTKLATDLFHFEGDSYLLLVDYTSHFPIVHKLKSMTAKHIADHIKQIFAEYGWPDTIVSDNGPCYTSEIFKDLMKEYQVKPHHKLAPLSTIKWSSRKICSNNKELILQGKRRGTRSTLMLNDIQKYSSIKPSPITYVDLIKQRYQIHIALSNAGKRQMGIQSEELRVKQKDQHLPTHDLCLNQTVMYQEPISKKWYPARITKLCKEPRSYIITTKERMQYRKMQMHLKPYQPMHQTNNIELWTTTPCNDIQIQLRPGNNIKCPTRLQIVKK